MLKTPTYNLDKDSGNVNHKHKKNKIFLNGKVLKQN